VLVAIGGALLSLLVHGFQFGAGNNIYHIPIVLDLGSEPQFATDPFYQSLRYFVSGVYPALRLIATEDTVLYVFFAMHVVTRALTLYVLLELLVLTGGIRPLTAVAFVITMVASPFLRGNSRLADHELLVNAFTHSSLATALALGAFVAFARGRWRLSGVCAGLAFCANAFVGIWTAVLLIGVGTLHVIRRREPQAEVRGIVQAAALCAIVASPVAIWMLASGAVGTGEALSFEYREFLRAYYDLHWFLDGRPAEDYLYSVQLGALGLMALFAAPSLRSIAHVYVGCLLVFAVGAALPLVTGSRLLLNLCLLRIEGLLVFLGVAGVAAAAISIGEDRDGGRGEGLSVLIPLALGAVAGTILVLIAVLGRQRMFVSAGVLVAVVVPSLLGLGTQASPIVGIGAIFVAGMAAALAGLGIATGTYLLCVLAAVVAAESLIGGAVGWWIGAGVAVAAGLLPHAPWIELRNVAWVSRSGVRLGVLILLAATVATRAIQRSDAAQRVVARRAPQIAIAEWARDNTSASAIFLTPFRWDEFQWRARRQIWVDFKQGSAVAWAPAFHDLWTTRRDEVAGLRDFSDIVRYACANHIGYAIVADPIEDVTPVEFSSDGWHVLNVAGLCQRSTPAP
jgi:hypothetical protein